MKNPKDLLARLSAGLAFTLALTGAGCGVAVDPGNQPDDGERPALPDLRPDLPSYAPDEDGVMRFRAAQGALRQTIARGTADGGNADGVHGCVASQPGYDHYENDDNVSGIQLHVVGIYTSVEGLANADQLGPVEVTVDRPGKSVLVLSAYDSVEWNIEVAEGATLEGVIASGYGTPIVHAPAGVPVVRYSFEEDGEYLGDVGYEWPSFRTTELIDAAEILTGLALTSFRGCYATESFVIEQPGALRPPHEVSPSPDPGVIAGCESLAAESHYCMAENIYGVGGYTMVGLDTGATCGQITTDIDSQLFAEASLAWVGDYLYTCIYDRGVARIAIADGSVDIAPLPCTGVTGHEGDLLVLLAYEWEEFQDVGWYLARFPSFADAVERRPDAVYEMAPWGTRMTAHGDKVYFAWHSTDEFQHAEIKDGAELLTTPLEVFDDWIMGMDVTDDGKLIIAGQVPTGGLNIFDAETGAFERTVASDLAGSYIGAIDCTSGAPE